MERVSQDRLAMEQSIAAGAEFRYDLGDAASASFEEAFRAGPTMAITRAVESYFDTSTKIDPNAANDQFGLTGTDAAFKEDDEVTVDKAKAVSDDYYRLKLNSVIKETVNAESPVMGNVTQFAASVAAGFADPVMLAANMGGAAIVGRAGSALVNSKRAFDTVSKISAPAGKFIAGAYQEGIKRSVTAIVAREGLENFVGGVIEEGIIRGMDVGEERLAVKTDWTDSMLNITAGTILGTGLGVTLSKEGRNAVIAKFGKLYGDDAPMRITSDLQMSDMESRLGIEKSHFEHHSADFDTYDAKPWHGDVKYTGQSATDIPQKVYISVAEDGTAHRPIIMGRGTVLHDNLNMAYNKGAKVLEIDTANLRIIRPQDMVDAKGRQVGVGLELKNTLAFDVATKTDASMLSRALAVLDDPDIDDSAVPTLNRNQLIAKVKEKLDGKNIDEMIDVMNDLGVKNQIAYDPHSSVNRVLEKAGWNGYMFSAKKTNGDVAYNGMYVLEKFNKKLTKSAEIQAPTPSAGDLIKYNNIKEQRLKDYHDFVALKAKALKQTGQESAGIPKKTVDETITPPKTEMQEVLLGSVEDKTKFDVVTAELDAKVIADKADETSKALKKLSDELRTGKSTKDMALEVRKMLDDFDTCMRG